MLRMPRHSTHLDHGQHSGQAADALLQAWHTDVAGDFAEHVERLLEATDGGVGGLLGLRASQFLLESLHDLFVTIGWAMAGRKSAQVCNGTFRS